jgi:predicted peptidase
MTFLLFLIGATMTSSYAVTQEAGFQDREARVGATVYRYKVFVPGGWSKEQKWPVILFLHGAGERGADNVAQIRVGLGPAIRREAKAYRAVVVMPQCSAGRWWPEPDMQAQAIKALEQSMSEFNGDPERVYLTGISMGGYGTWALAANHPGRFAALVPVCGGVVPPPRAPIPPVAAQASPSVDPYAVVAKKVGKTPVWVFHGEADLVVPVSESRKMVEALRAVGGNVRYSEYAGVGHNSWDAAYAEPEFLYWLLGIKSRI